MSSENKQTLIRFIEEVWNRGDLDRIAGFVALSYTVFHDPGDPWDGKVLEEEGLRERIRISRAPFPDQRFEPVHMIAEGDNVVFAWTWRAAHRGDFPGFPATNKVITMSGVTVYTFENGKIAGHWQVADRLGVFQQLSAMTRSNDDA
ncbi:ester cyclase [Hyphococcus sp.]|uniref:ester cyclase n=1 Tax=Hyphococcus sp. TaxID=2038636 RepID=UPI002087B791|nr:MAG: hypothetical protein DHS20C04_22250 [Marinicaulis sp.]